MVSGCRRRTVDSEIGAGVSIQMGISGIGLPVPEVLHGANELVHRADRGRRHDDQSLARHRFIDDGGDALSRVAEHRMAKMGEGRADDQRVHFTGNRCRIAENCRAGPAHAAGIDDAMRTTLAGPQVDAGRSQRVARFGELEHEVAAQMQRPMTRLPDRELLRREDIGKSVQLLPSGFQFERGLGQQNRGAVAGGGRGVDRSVKAMPYELRRASGRGEAGVGEQDGVNLGGIEREFPVFFGGLRHVALKEPGVQQDARAGRLEQDHRAGGGGCSAEERQGARRAHLVPKRRSPASPRPGRI